MKCECRKIAAITLLLSLVLAPTLAAAEPVGAIGLGINDHSLKERAEAMLSVADKAKVRVETLLNSILTNNTLIDMINEANLTNSLEMANDAFNLGANALSSAHEAYNGRNYADAISLAMKSMGYFRDAYKELNRILCKIGVLKSEVIEGRGLLIAIQCALERIEKIREIFERIANRTGIDITSATAKLDEAKNILNITNARELLQQGNVSEVAQMLREANRLLSEAFKELKTAIRELVANRIERFKERLRQIRERIRERLQNKSISEDEFYRQWGFDKANEFWRKHIEIMERVRERLMEGQEINATDLKTISRRLHEIRLELEIRLREREGEEAIEVSVEKIGEIIMPWRITVTLRVTVRNIGNTTLIFPNMVFGITVEKKENGAWRFYHSPFSAQALRLLEPGESREIIVWLRDAEPGNYRVVVNAYGRPAVDYAEFELP